MGAKVISGIFFGVAFLWFCVVCYLRSRIQLAIGLVKASSKAICKMPVIIFWPILQVAGLIVFLVPWMFYCVFISTMGEFNKAEDIACNADDVCSDGKKFSHLPVVEYYGWFMLFAFFWTSQFIVAMGQIIVAMAISKWYFTKDKDSIGNSTVFWAIKSGMRYHMGTAAFGSLLIAIIKMIQAVVTYIEQQTKKITDKNEFTKKLAALIFCCIRCCLWCIEKFMKFLNKNAYVQTAIYGTSFMTSAKKAFFLILRNAARISAVSLISEFVLTIGKLFIAGFSGFVCYYIIVESPSAIPVSSPYSAVLFVMILAWFTSQLFCEIFGMCMPTLLQCFIADEEMGTGFADAELKEFLDDNGSDNKA